MRVRAKLLAICGMILSAVFVQSASAGDYPDHPVKMIAPFQAGGPGARQFKLIGELDFPTVRCRVEFRLDNCQRRLHPLSYGCRMGDGKTGGLIQPAVALCLAVQCHLWRVDCCPIQRT